MFASRQDAHLVVESNAVARCPSSLMRQLVSQPQPAGAVRDLRIQSHHEEGSKARCGIVMRASVVGVDEAGANPSKGEPECPVLLDAVERYSTVSSWFVSER